MQVTLYGSPVKLNVTTVTISPSISDQLNLFRCEYCTRPINQYLGDIVKINPMMEPTNDSIAIFECRTDFCKENHVLYTFQSHKYKRKETWVRLLSLTDKRRSECCHSCRTPLINYDNTSVMLLPSYEKRTLPFRLACPNPKCQMSYYFFDLV